MVNGIDAACDPEMPVSLRRWVRGQRWQLTPEKYICMGLTGYASLGAWCTILSCWLLAAVCLSLLFVDPFVGAGWLAVPAAVMGITAGTVGHMSHARDLRLSHGRFIFPASLDESSRPLLERAQRAIRAILRSGVPAAGLLEHPVDEGTLQQHEWEIASRLRKITSARSQLARNTQGKPLGPMTSDVLSGQQRAIALAQDAAAARVSDLESYASCIVAAKDADRDWRQAVKLSSFNEQYLDLVAGTAADEHASREIANLTAQIAAAAQARQDRLREADLAAEVLALPQPRPADGDAR